MGDVSKVKFAKCIEGQIWDLGYTACPCGASRVRLEGSWKPLWQETKISHTVSSVQPRLKPGYGLVKQIMQGVLI
jgi:hypothetical protein